MKPKYGITSKLFAWFFLFVLFFYGTMLILYINVRQIVEISENIVSKNYEIASTSKKMLENLLNMEESENKYRLLEKKDYLNFFLSAQKEYKNNLLKILSLESTGFEIRSHWKELYESYRLFVSSIPAGDEATGLAANWIPEAVLNEWIKKISLALSENEQDIVLATRDLNRRGQSFARNALVGLGFSSLVGLIGIMFLAYSMIRPLKELQKGIRSISQEKFKKPIQIRSQDEFGELAGAFNEMALWLKEEEKMRSDFISMLSHEIRTPLTSIRESVNMIAEEVMGTINPRQRKFLKIASSEIGRINSLLNHLMQVSRLQSGIVKVSPRPIETAPFVENCIKQLSPVAAKKNIDIESAIPKIVPQLLADPEHLQRVLHNLLGNAIKFSAPDSRINLKVETEANHKQLKFSIADNGPGIPQEEHTLIFKKYYQGQGVRRHMDGVGLGLNISKHIIDAHQGRIWVESIVGTGSTFAFTIPAVR